MTNHCIYPRCNCPIDKNGICVRGLPEPEEVKMDYGVWTRWLENPGTGDCPVPEWAEDYQVVTDLVGRPTNYGSSKDWRWTLGNGADITHYRYQVPADLAHLAANYGSWNTIVGPVTHVDRKGWTYKEWSRARRDLGYQTPGAESQIFGAGAQIPGAEQPPSKYHRNIKGVYVDVYDIIHAYGITNPGDQHAIKKMLQAGNRGYKSARQDREEAIVSLRRANELEADND